MANKKIDNHSIKGPHRPVRLYPNPNYKPLNLHTQQARANGAPINSLIVAEWCPICHGREILEKKKTNRAVWYCKNCDYEW